LLKQPGVLKALLDERLPMDGLEGILTETAQLRDPNFADMETGTLPEDLFVEVSGSGDLVVLLFVLIEHKSYPERWVSWQLLKYIVGALTEYRMHHPDDALPRVRTMVLYHGEDPWNVPREFNALYQGGASRSTVADLNFRYELVSCWDIADAELSKHRLLRAGLLVPKYAWQPEKLLAVTPDALLACDGNEELVKQFLLCIAQRLRDRNQFDRLENIVHRTIPQEVPVFYSIVDQFRDEAKLEGKLQGKASSLERLLRRRFRRVPKATVERIYSSDEASIDVWFDRAIDAPTLKDVMAGP